MCVGEDLVYIARIRKEKRKSLFVLLIGCCVLCVRNAILIPQVPDTGVTKRAMRVVK